MGDKATRSKAYDESTKETGGGNTGTPSIPVDRVHVAPQCRPTRKGFLPAQAIGEIMLRAPSLAAQCALSAVGSASRRKEGARVAIPLVRALASTTADLTKAHVRDNKQQRRYVSHSSRICGWASAVGIPGLSDDVRERNNEASAARQALEVSLLYSISLKGCRHTTPGSDSSVL